MAIEKLGLQYYSDFLEQLVDSYHVGGSTALRRSLDALSSQIPPVPYHVLSTVLDQTIFQPNKSASTRVFDIHKKDVLKLAQLCVEFKETIPEVSESSRTSYQ